MGKNEKKLDKIWKCKKQVDGFERVLPGPSNSILIQNEKTIIKKPLTSCNSNLDEKWFSDDSLDVEVMKKILLSMP